MVLEDSMQSCLKLLFSQSVLKTQTAPPSDCYIQDQDTLSGCAFIVFKVCANEQGRRGDTGSRV